ncbi:hypothetical protein DPEC_G00067560 [Dallia pectoralis]|uniref:Uncharacterized protein n=1 Tax=Dallia pectoralis TaxID=75939 RepID=A0ACC2H8V3_DALPE|nr:hypothetical protein DPEC_G00067560 [Dallia pectoralis]
MVAASGSLVLQSSEALALCRSCVSLSLKRPGHNWRGTTEKPEECHSSSSAVACRNQSYLPVTWANLETNIYAGGCEMSQQPGRPEVHAEALLFLACGKTAERGQCRPENQD